MSNSTKLSARDRIATLLDDNSFVEIGALVTKRNTDFNLQTKEAPSDGVITGYGVINGAPVYVYSQDASVLAGAVGEMHAKKIVNLYKLAMKTGAPVIPVAIDGTAALFERNGHWIKPGKVNMAILPPIETEGMARADFKELPARTQRLVAEAKEQFVINAK